MLACPDDETLARFLAGRADAEAARRLDAHVAACVSCYELLSSYAQSYGATVSTGLDSSQGPPEQVSQDGARTTAETALERLRREGVLSAGTIVGRYVLLGWVGEGGAGVVYAAYDPELDRKVALKLMRSPQRPVDPERIQAMLSREARAMAKLAHPHVAAVHDTGTFEGRVFIAMEFIEGPTLRRWLEEARPTVRLLLDVFVDAGRGLSAAHAAGLVHRDFNPENVLLAPDGRPRVTDFGLARLGAEDRPPPSAEDTSPRRSTWAGTPAYMAPEQRRGAADAQSDQFSFCVSLYEALYGEHPFGPDVASRELPPVFPTRARVRTPLRKVLARGLHLDPSKRYASMGALLAELEQARRPRSAAPVAFVLLLGMAAAGVMFGVRPREAPAAALCKGAADKFAESWNDSRSAAMAATFRASGAPFADDAWRATARTLDAYGRDWAAERTEACEATRVRGEQSEAVLGQRMQCLDRRLLEMRALTDVLGRADAKVVERALQASQELVLPSSCSTVRARADDEASRADPTIRASLATAESLRLTGQYSEAQRAAEPALERARASGQSRLVAEACDELGEIAGSRMEADVSETRFFDGLESAQRAGADDLAARAASGLVESVGFQQGRPDGERWYRLAMSILDRMGGGDDRERARSVDAPCLGARKDRQSSRGDRRVAQCRPLH